jgi:chromosome partitioning protein
MVNLRDTYAEPSAFPQRLKAVSNLLCISENTLRNHLAESGIDITRQSSTNPSAPAIRIFTIEKIFEIASWRRKTGKVKKITNRPIGLVVNLIKGGVGKSTTTAEVAIQLQLKGYSVLVIDLDPSSNLTSLMGYEPDLELNEAKNYGLTEKAIVKYTFDHLCTPFIESRRNREHHWIDSEEVIKKPFGEFGPHLIPSDVYLGDLSDKLNTVPGDRDHVIKAFLNAANIGKVPGFDTSIYDFILMDCAPSVSQISLNAMATADYVIAPVKMDLFGAKGISRLNTEINSLKSRAQDVDLELVILPTHYSRNINRTARMTEQLQSYKDNLTVCSIPQSEMFPSSQSYYMPLTLQMPTSIPVAAYREFTDILLRKILKKFS